jgi:cyclopropane-fatty-acyl-phospholipid synthase
MRYQDYRDLAERHADAPFDAIVSIEMFEAVGREYWRGYFETLRACLKPGGHACIRPSPSATTCSSAMRSTDFIQQYIFPGGLLPSPRPSRPRPAAPASSSSSAGLRPDYAETLRRWREAFLRQIDTVQRLGFDARFQRIWAFYLAYCEAAFDTGNTDVIQFTLRKPLP